MDFGITVRGTIDAYAYGLNDKNTAKFKQMVKERKAVALLSQDTTHGQIPLKECAFICDTFYIDENGKPFIHVETMDTIKGRIAFTLLLIYLSASDKSALSDLKFTPIFDESRENMIGLHLNLDTLDSGFATAKVSVVGEQQF